MLLICALEIRMLASYYVTDAIIFLSKDKKCQVWLVKIEMLSSMKTNKIGIYYGIYYFYQI